MRLDDLLACPVCHAALNGVACTSCGRTYALEQGVHDFTPLPPPDAEVQAQWSVWETLQANGEHAYEADASANLSVGEREDASAFAAFARLDGTILDVGCGPQVLPSYAHGIGDRLVGLDPLVGVQPREFAFVKGIAEYLPFADGAFDRVLFATSLDHVLSPALTLAEAHRVTRPGGAVVVWLGEEVAPPRLVHQARNAIRRLAHGEVRGVAADARALLAARRAPAPAYDVPEGAIDAFHFDHPDATTIEGWLATAGLQVEAVERPLGNNCFIRAVRR
jgi:SAM-dependent methyltransferase